MYTGNTCTERTFSRTILKIFDAAGGYIFAYVWCINVYRYIVQEFIIMYIWYHAYAYIITKTFYANI